MYVCVCHACMPQYMVCMCMCMHAPCAYATIYGGYVCVYVCVCIYATCMYATVYGGYVCVHACTCHACMPQYMEGVCEGVCVHASCAYAQILEWKKGELVSNASQASFLQSVTPNPILLFLSCGGGQHSFSGVCFLLFFSCVCCVFFLKKTNLLRKLLCLKNHPFKQYTI